MKFNNFDLQKLLFCNIAWMKEYRGITDDDKPIGGGGYVVETGKAEEKHNFHVWDGYCYGYTRAPNNGNMKIENLGAVASAPSVSGITVVWAAKNPVSGGRKLVVGWYQNATVFREMQNDDGYYRVCAKKKDCHLIPAEQRHLNVPVGGRPIAYGTSRSLNDENKQKFLKQLDILMDGTLSKLPSGGRKKSTGKAWADVTTRQAVEQAAVNCVCQHYKTAGWPVTSVESENVGWDLTVAPGTQDELHVEVKGHSGNHIHCELTPNEYKHAKSTKHNYRLAVVTNALAKPCLRIFMPGKSAGKLTWSCVYSTGTDVTVTTTKKTGAVISEQ